MSGADPGGLCMGSRDPLQKYTEEAKRIMYWYVEISVISALYAIKQPISSMGLHSPHPLLHIWLLNTSVST